MFWDLSHAKKEKEKNVPGMLGSCQWLCAAGLFCDVAVNCVNTVVPATVNEHTHTVV